MKNKFYKIIFVFLLLITYVWLFFINETNYKIIKEQKRNIVNHPELLPKKGILKYTSFGFSNLRADLYWLEAIQYIWSNAVSSEYKKYLFSMIDIITELNPYFENPYLIGQLLLPNYNERYEKLGKKDIDLYSNQWRLIGEKWIKNFCNEDKIKLILNQKDLNKIWTDEKYKNPCKSIDIPFQQWFLEYYYLKNHKESADYYKISSVDENSLPWAKIMAWIMNWKAWNREISIMTFLSLANWKKEEKSKCSYFTDILTQLSGYTFRLNNPINSETIKQLQQLREENFYFDENNEQELLAWENCSNYINKAIREFNMAYLDQQNKLYFEKFKQFAKTPKELLDKWLIDYIPVDFQQYKNQWIIYYFNEETNNFDTQMSN